MIYKFNYLEQYQIILAKRLRDIQDRCRKPIDEKPTIGLHSKLPSAGGLDAASFGSNRA
jgi:hypothetical protein